MAGERKKIVYILAGVSGRMVAFEWVAKSLSRRYEMFFVLLEPRSEVLQKYLEGLGISVKVLRYRGKRDLLPVIWTLYRYFRRHKPHAVHTHLREANLTGLVAARVAGIRRRIYTRHHSTFNHLYYPRAVKVDRWINRMATHIVAISPNVQRVLREREQVPARKVRYIPHGFDMDWLQEPVPEGDLKLREKYQIPKEGFVVGCVARFIEWKGLQYVLKAFKKLLQKDDRYHLVLANAHGPYRTELEQIWWEIPSDKLTLIHYEPDIRPLYDLFDVFVHVPVDAEVEAFGQIYVEALARGVPSVFTMSGIAHEFVKDGEQALVVPYGDPSAIARAVDMLRRERGQARKLAQAGRKAVADFTLPVMIRRLEELYA